MSDPSKIQIFVRTLSGTTCTLEVSQDEAVENVKKMLEERDGVPASQQRLIYAGKQLQDGKTLTDYAVKDESTVHLVLAL